MEVRGVRVTDDLLIFLLINAWEGAKVIARGLWWLVAIAVGAAGAIRGVATGFSPFNGGSVDD